MISLALGTLWRPPVAVAGMLCLYGLDQWLQSRQGLFLRISYLTNIGMASVVALGLVVAGLRQRLQLADYPRVGYLVLALLGFALLSFLWTPDRAAFMERWILAGPYLLTIVLMMPLLVRDWQDVQTAFYATLILGTLTLSLLAFNAEWTYRGLAIGRDQMGNPLAVASLGGYVALIALLMNFSGVARVWQITRWGVFLLGLYISMRSGSRGQTIALVFAAFAFLPLSRRFTSFKGLAATLVGVVCIGVIVAWAQSIWATTGRWDFERMSLDYGGGRLGKISFLLGEWLSAGPLAWVIGLGNSASFDEELLGFYPHLVLGEVLAEQGLIGFGLFVAILFLAFRAVLRGARAGRDVPVMRGIFAVLGALLLFDFILSFKQGSMIGTPYLFAFCIMLGRIAKTLPTGSKLIAARSVY